jgi:PAS domain S-box-containing protein
LTFVNDAYCRYFGKSREELMGESVVSLLTEEKRAVHQERMDKLLHENPINTYEQKGVTGGGDLRWIRWTDKVIYDDNGDPVEIQSVGQDIHDRKMTELALKESEAKLSAVVNHARDSIFIKDLEGRYLLINPAGADVIGKPVHEIIGKTDAAAFNPEIGRQIQEIAKLVLEMNDIYTYEISRNIKGETRYFLNTKYPYRSFDGEVQGIVGVSRDVTEQKQAELALQDSESRLRAIIDNTTDAIFIKDVEGRYLLMNPAGCEIMGLPESAIIGKTDFDLLDDDAAREIQESDNYVQQTREPYIFEQTIRINDEAYTLIVAKTPYVAHNGDLIGTIAIAHNITERKKAEQALRESEERFRQMAENISETLYVFDPSSYKSLYISPVY